MSKEVILCPHAGVCFGAGRAVDMLENAIAEGGPIYTYGPILHNTKLVESYENRGVKVVNSPEELKSLPKGKVIIRAHGVSKAVYEELKESGFEILDATCPFVKRIHRIVEKESSAGKTIIVIGNPVHPEVLGIVGWSVNGAYVVETKEEALALKINKEANLCIVAQTTFNRNKFQELVEIFTNNSYNIECINTICDATTERQEEAEELSKKVSVMIVIGDTSSSNSKKLYEICKANCENTFFIQTVDDIKGELTKISGLVGITAGASTPKYIIEEVQNYVRNDF